MGALRILYVCHNDPRLHSGGTEIFARDLFQSIGARPGIKAMFLAGTNNLHRRQRPGTAFQTIDRSADELLYWAGHFDPFFQVQADVYGVFTEFMELLRSFRPQVIHFQHLLLIGADALAAVRRALPEARIVLTLHDYYPICHQNGIMLKVPDHRPCERATPGDCTACFPTIAPAAFRLREVNLKNHLRLVDRFIAPSHFLRDRYVDWGLEPERIEVVRNGCPPLPAAPIRPLTAGPRRNAFAVFGNVSPFKGTRVAVDAARLLLGQGERDFNLTIHGSLDFQADAFKEAFKSAVAETAGTVVYRGKYDRARVPGLMRAVDWVIVPSIWWENAPLVIGEAFRHGRPVLCSNIGGMAERVRDGIDGLHFEADNPVSLMQAMQRALNEPELWDRLSAAILPAVDIDACADRHLDLYDRVGAARG